MKFCHKCKHKKREIGFAKCISRADGLQPQCKSCTAEWATNNTEKIRAGFLRRMRKNPIKMRRMIKNARLKHLYKFSTSELDQKLFDQAGKCAICKEPIVKPNVDHCHTTGKVRGLLCAHCNRGLGGFRDSPKYLRAAAIYLENS